MSQQATAETQDGPFAELLGIRPVSPLTAWVRPL